MKELKQINLENATEQETDSFDYREAVRAITFNTQNEVGLLYSRKYKYYKLPGGGIELDENHEVALKRECREEIGVDIEILSAIGSITEYKKKTRIKQTSFCYVARTTNIAGEISHTEDELEEEFEPVWLALDDAINKVRNNSREGKYEIPYMTERDLAFLLAFKIERNKIDEI